MASPAQTLDGPAAAPPTTFDVGEHKVTVAKIQEGRWSVAVDQHPLDHSFQTQAEAWEAGVREILRIGGLPKV